MSYSPSSFIVAEIREYAGSSAPSGWLFCAGQAVSRTTYASLFAVIGTTYGSGDGSTTFNVPDKRGRTGIGKDDMGGSSASRLTNTSLHGVTGTTLGSSGGSDGHTLTGAQSGTPSHSHAHTFSVTTTINYQAQDGNQSSADARYTYWDRSGAGTPSSTGVASSLGGSISNASAANASSAHTNLQPSMVFNYIIKV